MNTFSNLFIFNKIFKYIIYYVTIKKQIVDTVSPYNKQGEIIIM